MPNPFAVLINRLRRLARTFGAARGRAARNALVRREWVSLGVNGPAPLLVMYRDILGQHGIQAVIMDTGVGPGALGGVPGFGALRVAASDIDAARAVLRAETDQDEASTSPHVPSVSERINDRGE